MASPLPQQKEEEKGARQEFGSVYLGVPEARAPHLPARPVRIYDPAFTAHFFTEYEPSFTVLVQAHEC